MYILADKQETILADKVLYKQEVCSGIYIMLLHSTQPTLYTLHKNISKIKSSLSRDGSMHECTG